MNRNRRKKPIFPSSFCEDDKKNAIFFYKNSIQYESISNYIDRLFYDNRMSEVWTDWDQIFQDEFSRSSLFWVVQEAIKNWHSADKRTKKEKAEAIEDILKAAKKLLPLLKDSRNLRMLSGAGVKRKISEHSDTVYSTRFNEETDEITKSSYNVELIIKRAEDSLKQSLEIDKRLPKHINNKNAFSNYLIDRLCLHCKLLFLNVDADNHINLKKNQLNVLRVVHEIVYIVSDVDPSENVRERMNRITFDKL